MAAKYMTPYMAIVLHLVQTALYLHYKGKFLTVLFIIEIHTERYQPERIKRVAPEGRGASHSAGGGCSVLAQ
jgi:hypothetical protein